MATRALVATSVLRFQAASWEPLEGRVHVEFPSRTPGFLGEVMEVGGGCFLSVAGGSVVRKRVVGAAWVEAPQLVEAWLPRACF